MTRIPLHTHQKTLKIYRVLDVYIRDIYAKIEVILIRLGTQKYKNISLQCFLNKKT